MQVHSFTYLHYTCYNIIDVRLRGGIYMITTSSYREFENSFGRTYSISENGGRDANYNGMRYTELEPLNSFLDIWKNNRGKISEEKNNGYYIEEYWKQVLSKLNVEEVYKSLDSSTLLCYEDNDLFCHRHIVSAWFELLLGASVPEVDSGFEEVSKPEYIKLYLEEVIKNSVDMCGFTSLRALYLFEKSKKVLNMAQELEKTTGNKNTGYYEMAVWLNDEALRVEECNYSNEKQKRLLHVGGKKR